MCARRVHREIKKNLVTANVSRLVAHMQGLNSEGRGRASTYKQSQLLEVERSKIVGLTPILSAILRASVRQLTIFDDLALYSA